MKINKSYISEEVQKTSKIENNLGNRVTNQDDNPESIVRENGQTDD